MMWSSARAVLAGWLAALWRRLWIAAAVAVLVAAVAVARYAGPGAAGRHRYLATQTLVISVMPPDGGGALATAGARQMEGTIALELATPAGLGAPALDRAVAARFGTPGGPGGTAEARAVAQALTATHDGNAVTLTARWTSPEGAVALLRAATGTLTSDVGLLPGAEAVSAEGGSLRVLVEGAATGPRLDPGPEDAARARLLETLALGLCGGVALALSVEARARRQGVTASAPQPSLAGLGEERA